MLRDAFMALGITLVDNGGSFVGYRYNMRTEGLDSSRLVLEIILSWLISLMTGTGVVSFWVFSYHSMISVLYISKAGLIY